MRATDVIEAVQAIGASFIGLLLVALVATSIWLFLLVLRNGRKLSPTPSPMQRMIRDMSPPLARMYFWFWIVGGALIVALALLVLGIALARPTANQTLIPILTIVVTGIGLGVLATGIWGLIHVRRRSTGPDHEDCEQQSS